MKILLVCATALESNLIREIYSYSSDSDGIHEFGKNKPALLITGIGMVNTSYYLGKYLDKIKPDIVIHFGIAGTFVAAIPIGSVVEITRDYFGEMGAESQYEFLNLKIIGYPSFIADGKKNYNLVVNPGPSTLDVKKVKGITNNTTHGNPRRIKEMLERFPAEVETMESAALFQCCLMSGIPFWSFRGISNLVGPRDKKSWKLNEAAENVQKVVLKAMETL